MGLDFRNIRDRAIMFKYFSQSGGADEIAPTLVSIEVGAVADDEIVLTYSEELDDSTPAKGDYSVVGSALATISTVTVDGLTVTLAMSDDIYDF